MIERGQVFGMTAAMTQIPVPTTTISLEDDRPKCDVEEFEYGSRHSFKHW